MKLSYRNVVVVVMALVMPLLILPGTAFASDCKVTEIKALSNNCKLRDQGYKPNITCTATIAAPKGFFILSGEVSSSTTGTTYGDPSTFSTSAYNHEIMTKYPFFKSAFLQSAALTSRCSRGGGGIGDRTCTAAATLTAKAYPHSCLIEKLQGIVADLKIK